MSNRKPLDVTVVGSHIFLKNTLYEDRARWGAIPAGRWDRKKKYWRYPASPFAAYRIIYHAECLNQPVTHDAVFRTLLDEMKHIRELEHYCKGSNSLDVAEKTRDTAFDTVTKPWAHQVLASDFSKSRGMAYLAMDMGTGKTMVGINELEQIRGGFILIVCLSLI